VTGAWRTNRGWRFAAEHHRQALSELGASEAVDEKVGGGVESDEPVGDHVQHLIPDRRATL